VKEVPESSQVIESMERETGFEPATSSLGIHPYIESKSLARFCCDFLNLQRLAESAFSKSVYPNESQMRQVPGRFCRWRDIQT
jgi:hypothetical protein